MYRFVVLCLSLLALKEAQGQTTQVNKCIRSKAILPINAYVEGCIEPPCVLHQLEDVVINVVFEAPYLLYNMTTKALAIVKLGLFPLEVNYDLKSNAVTCNFLTNTYCPIQKNEVVQYTLKMFIESFFPAGTVATIEFRVEDKNDLPVWCIRLPIEIVEPRSQALAIRCTYADPGDALIANKANSMLKSVDPLRNIVQGYFFNSFIK